ncbi:MAG TPA: aspartate ammonia-lyase [Bacteroidales bacterium]|nr:aspartate ammonia-lyase [Bacteroidales bacterium]
MDKANAKEFIKKVELFRGIGEAGLSSIANHIYKKSYSPGDYLFTQGTPRMHIFIVCTGSVELFTTNTYGDEKRLTLFSSGDFFGEGSLMDDAPHSTNARITEDAEMLILDNSYFYENGSIAVKVLSNVARIISRRMQHANNMSNQSASQYVSGKTRTEHDLLGYREVPYESYYGIQTLRAMENFNISGVTLNFYPVLIEALAMVKMAAVKANNELGLIDETLTQAIVQACQEVMSNRYHYHFVVDMIQGGAGTSTNMNANEVIANRALEILGYEKGEYKHCHPNNHVNLSQSTNDAYPTAIKIALINNNKKLIEVLKNLIKVTEDKGREFAHILKMGRTQLQDAVPMSLGQSFDAYAVTLTEEINNLTYNASYFLEVNMGGTAIGTGINAEVGYSEKVIRHLREITGMDIKLALNLIEATQDTGSFVAYSGAVKRLAIKLSKMSNDLRLMSSGPRAGFNEINLPPMQPGSTIMPGKVNPVIPEVVNQIAFKVIGNDLTVGLAAEHGQLELNVFEPVIVQSLFESVEMLKNGMDALNHSCIRGITANEEHCRNMIKNSIGIVTALNPYIGYDNANELAKDALTSGRGVYELVLEKGLLSKEKLDEILTPENMINPQKRV